MTDKNSARLNRRRFLAAAGAGATVAVAGCLGTTSDPFADVEAPDNSVTNVRHPGSAPYNYPVAGVSPGEAQAEVYYFGSFKCPVCATFGENAFPTLVSEYLETEPVFFQYRHLSFLAQQSGGFQNFLGPDAGRIGNADIAVWKNAADDYWTFHNLVFENQPPESQSWGSVDNLVAAAEAAGVSDTSPIRQAVRDAEYTSALERTATVANGLGVSGTPSFYVVDRNPSGQDNTQLLTGPDGGQLYNALDQILQQ